MILSSSQTQQQNTYIYKENMHGVSETEQSIEVRIKKAMHFLSSSFLKQPHFQYIFFPLERMYQHSPFPNFGKFTSVAASKLVKCFAGQRDVFTVPNVTVILHIDYFSTKQTIVLKYGTILLCSRITSPVFPKTTVSFKIPNFESLE